MKLSLPEFQVGRDRAEKYVLHLCKALRLPAQTKNDLKSPLTLNLPEKTLTIDFNHEIEYVRRRGKADALQMMHDSRDRFLNTPLSLGIAGDDVGVKVKLSSSCGGEHVTIGYGVIEAPEVSFADDISYYRRAVVDTSNASDLPAVARNYRAYLQSCVSLVECFLNRYVFHIKRMIPSTAEYDNTAMLDSRLPIEQRIDAWITTFAIHKAQEWEHAKQRAQFIELKLQRNALIHGAQPLIGYDIHQLVRYLNYAKEGVGGLLAKLRRFAGDTDHVGFIQQVATQQNVLIIKRTPSGKK